MIYSEYIGKMIPDGFTIKKVYIDKTGNKPYLIDGSVHYTWNEEDLLYYSDDTDESYFMEIPKNGTRRLSITHVKDGYYRMKWLVIIDE